jgi:hypothetical protein
MLQKLRDAIQLLRDNALLFSLIVLTVWLPGALLIVYLRLYVFPATLGGDEMRMAIQELRITNGIEFALGPLYVSALLYAASRRQQGLAVTYGDAMAHGARRSFKLLISRLGAGVLVVLGLLALIVPGIILALRFALLDAVVSLEGLEGGQARKRSTLLTQGQRWTILGTLIGSFLVAAVGMVLTSFSLYFLLGLAGQEENFGVAVLYECVSNVLLTLPMLVLFLFYWDAKDRPASVGSPPAIHR